MVWRKSISSAQFGKLDWCVFAEAFGAKHSWQRMRETSMLGKQNYACSPCGNATKMLSITPRYMTNPSTISGTSPKLRTWTSRSLKWPITMATMQIRGPDVSKEPLPPLANNALGPNSHFNWSRAQLQDGRRPSGKLAMSSRSHELLVGHLHCRISTAQTKCSFADNAHLLSSSAPHVTAE